MTRWALRRRSKCSVRSRRCRCNRRDTRSPRTRSRSRKQPLPSMGPSASGAAQTGHSDPRVWGGGVVVRTDDPEAAGDLDVGLTRTAEVDQAEDAGLIAVQEARAGGRPLFGLDAAEGIGVTVGAPSQPVLHEKAPAPVAAPPLSPPSRTAGPLCRPESGSASDSPPSPFRRRVILVARLLFGVAELADLRVVREVMARRPGDAAHVAFPGFGAGLAEMQNSSSKSSWHPTTQCSSSTRPSMSQWLSLSHWAVQKSADFAATRPRPSPPLRRRRCRCRPGKRRSRARANRARGTLSWSRDVHVGRQGRASRNQRPLEIFLEQAPNARGVEIIAALSEPALGERRRASARRPRR